MTKIRKKIYSFLKLTEKITKTDMLYLVKGGFWLNLEQAVSSFASFFLSIAFANLIDPVTYGTYSYVGSVASFFGLLTLSGINSSVTRSVAMGDDGVIISALKTKIKWGLLGSLLSLFLSGFYFLTDNYQLSILFLIVAIFIPFTRSFSIYGAVLQGKKKFKLLTQINSICHIINNLFLVLILFLTDNIFIILLFYFLPGLILNVIYFLFILKKFGFKNNHSHEVISYGKYLSFIQIIAEAATTLEKVLLWFFLGPVSIAIYSFAIAPVEKIQGVFSNIKTLAFTKFSQSGEVEIKRTLPLKVFKLFLLIVPVVIIYIILIPYLFRLIYPQYMDSVVYSQFFVVCLFFLPQKFFVTYFKAHKKKRAITLTSTIMPIVRIIALIALVPVYGIYGIIWTRYLTGALNLFIDLFLFRKY